LDACRIHRASAFARDCLCRLHLPLFNSEVRCPIFRFEDLISQCEDGSGTQIVSASKEARGDELNGLAECGSPILKHRLVPR
ncbi:hypothetical protein, partial [Sinorhizobium meliloti]|uniref:hypothetical protein n=1 Tax=Rhizobium meliloti TaxID=382 RepID=UPI001AED05A1